MARKTLLTESEIRQFMKLANIKPLQEMGGSYGMPPGMRDDEEEDPPGMRDMREGEDEDEDPPGMRDMREEEGEEEMDAPAPEGGEEMEMGAEMGEEPAGDMEMDMDMGGDDMGAEGGAKEEQFADIVDKLADLLGLDADVEVGEGEMEMGGEAMDDEGGDLEGAMDAPVGDDEDMGVEVEDDELMGEEEIVQEVARRVAARLIREKKQDATASKLAERIFRRLASK
jgi:hypothetical protein